MQRVEKADLVYSSSGQKDVASSEPSRYIRQLQYYHDQGQGDLHLHSFQNELDTTIKEKPEITVQRDEFFREKLREKLKKGLSPTAISTYINCPLDFYFKYILGLRESDEIDEEIAADVFGNIIHNSLELLYQDFEEKEVDFDSIKENLSAVLDKVVSNELNNRWIRTGINRMNIEIIHKLLLRFIEKDEDHARQAKAKGKKMEVIKLEDRLSREIRFTKGSESYEVTLSGMADRIDKLGDITRIIDYKTGKVDTLNNVVIEKVFTNKNNSKALQLLLYQCMYDDFSSTDLEVGIVGFKSLEKYLQKVSLKKGQGDLRTNFYAAFEEFIFSMFNDEEEIKHDPSSTWCKFCEQDH